VSRQAWYWGAAAALIVLPVAALGIAVAVIDPNDYKPQLAAAVEDATGRPLSFGGPLRIRPSLWPTIEVNDVKLANLPGGSRPDMARAERIEAQLSLLALLWRRIEVIKLTLIGPNILFEEVGGQPNWEFNAAANPQASPPTPPGQGMTLRLRDVHVQNGMVTTRLPARTNVVGIRSLDFRHLTDSGPLKVTSVLVYSDYQPFSLNASAQPTGSVTDPWNTQLEFAAYETTAQAKGIMNLAGNYDMQVDAQIPTLEKLNALLPQMQLPALRQTTLSTHLTNGPVRGDLPVIGKTQMHIGSADLTDRIPGLKLSAVDVSLPAPGALATISGMGNFAGQVFTLGGTFGVPEHPDGRSSVPLDLTAQSPIPAKDGKAGGAAKGDAAVKGRLALNTGQFDGLDATVTLHTPALAMLRPVVSTALPALTDLSLDGRLVVPADMGALSFRGAKLSAHEGDLSGDMTIGLGKAAALNGKLTSNKLDMDAMLAAFGMTMPMAAGNVGPGRAAHSIISDSPLPWAILRGPVIDFTGHVGAMTFQKQNWQNFDIAIQLKGGKMQVNRLQVALPGGPLVASLTADASTDSAPVSVSLQARDIPLAIIARYADLPGQASGAMRMDAQLHAAGRSLHDLAASLDGPFSATMIGGSLSNAALIKLASASLQALSIKVPEQGETAIRCLGLIGAFSKGIARFRTIALDTTYVELSGAGQVDLGAETVALKLHPLAQLSGSSVSVPVVVEGPFRSVQGRLDASGLDKLGLLIDSWFGSDNPQTCSNAGLSPLPRAP
jgi:uncharacterized protein involved in outer membrane biogenesis